MKYKKVQRMQEEISEIGLGCWSFGGDWDESDDNNTEQIVLAAVEAGINLFDVAPVYGFGHSETVLGNVLKKHHLRDRVLIASKCGLLWNEKRETRNNLTKESILWEIEQSLIRLQTDTIDIYQLHWPDPNTPLEETASALKEIQASGKIRYIGLSNFSQKDVAKFEEHLQVHTQQSLYNMLERNTSHYHRIPLAYQTERDVLPYVREHGQAFFPYSPLFQGLLTGAFTMGQNFSGADIRNQNPKFGRAAFNPYYEAAGALKDFSASIGKPMVEVALNWLRQKPEVTSIISGAGNTEQLLGNLNCLEWELTTEMLASINKIIVPLEHV